MTWVMFHFWMDFPPKTFPPNLPAQIPTDPHRSYLLHLRVQTHLSEALGVGLGQGDVGRRRTCYKITMYIYKDIMDMMLYLSMYIYIHIYLFIHICAYSIQTLDIHMQKYQLVLLKELTFVAGWFQVFFQTKCNGLVSSKGSKDAGWVSIHFWNQHSFFQLSRLKKLKNVRVLWQSCDYGSPSQVREK